MAGEDSPRRSVKAFVRGERPARAWHFPLLFSVGSRLESLAPREFFSNPTKIASALRQIQATLPVDGLACYFDASLEAEAAGCQLDWGPEGPSLAAGVRLPDVETTRRGLGSPENIVRKGRIKIAAEVVRRLKLMLRDESALLVRVTGPLTLAQRIFHPQAAREGPPPQDEVELASEITAALSKHFVEAGADVVLLVEEILPLPDSETCVWWGELLDPIINVIRFYEALPVLLLSDPNVTAETLELICSRSWECVLCPTLSAVGLLPPARWRSQGAAIGFGLPTSTFVSGCDLDELIASVKGRAEELSPALLTTCGDVPADADFRQLAVVISLLREALWPTG